MFDLRVNTTAFAECVRTAVGEWLRRKGSTDKATVTVDGDGARIELSSGDDGGFEGVRTLSLKTTSSPALADDSVFDDALFDLIRERMAEREDLIIGKADDLS